MSNAEITTILGRGSAFEGKLTFEGTVRIDGQFTGEIRTQGVLIIGESAEVKAEIVAATIVIEGQVRGDITATEGIEIHTPARVYGNLTTPNLEIQKGSVFEGGCQMEAQEPREAQIAPTTQREPQGPVAEA